MKKLKLFALIILITLFNACDSKDAEPDDYFTAIIDNKKFDAKFIYLNRETSGNNITIRASSVNLLDKNLSNDDILKNPDYNFFEISFNSNCLEARRFNWDEISSDTSCLSFIYLFNDTTEHPEIKGFSSLMLQTDGFIEIESLNNKQNGSIIGNFEVSGMNYNEICFTDTIHINHGAFKFHFK